MEGGGGAACGCRARRVPPVSPTPTHAHPFQVPYRDSKLTRLLRDSLGGRTKTCVVATVAAAPACADETVSTLDYAHRAKNIRNRPEVNLRVSRSAHVRELVADLASARAELRAAREKDGVHLPLAVHEAREEALAVGLAKVEELEAALGAATEAAEAAEAAAAAELGATRGELADALAALGAAREGLRQRDALLAARGAAEEGLAGHATALTVALVRTR